MHKNHIFLSNFESFLNARTESLFSHCIQGFILKLTLFGSPVILCVAEDVVCMLRCSYLWFTCCVRKVLWWSSLQPYISEKVLLIFCLPNTSIIWCIIHSYFVCLNVIWLQLKPCIVYNEDHLNESKLTTVIFI